jgi:O-antigen ligase
MLRKYWNYDATFTIGALYLFLIFVNIARLRPQLAPLRPTFTVGTLAVVLLIMKGLRQGAIKPLGASGWCWVGLTAAAYISAIAAPKAQDVAMTGASGVAKMLATYFIAYNLITSLRTLKTLYWVFVISLVAMAYFALKVMMLSGGRLSLFVGPFYGINETAMGFTMFLPFCITLAALPSKDFRWNRVFAALAVLSTILVMRTFSRGGFVALMTVFIMWAVREKRKPLAIAVTSTMIVLVLVISGLMYLSPEPGAESYLDRLQLLTKLRNATERDVSAQGRIDCIREALSIWKKYPVLGIGRDCFTEHSQWQDYRALREIGVIRFAAVHNSEIHVLLEHGLVGLVLHLALLLTLQRNISRARKWPNSDPVMKAMLDATSLSLVAWFVGGLFLSEQFNWCFVILTGLAGGARKVIEAEDLRIAKAHRPRPSLVVPKPTPAVAHTS